MKMTRFTLSALALLLPATLLLAGQEREGVLLTESGTLFMVRSASALELEESGYEGEIAGSALMLSRVSNGERSSFLVPGSTLGTANLSPAIAWDDADQRLYVFWMRRPYTTSSELVITSWKDGDWGPEAVFASGRWTWRLNLQLAMTQRFEKQNADGEIRLADGLTVHALWWNQEGANESAMYAMFALRDGEIVSSGEQSLVELVDAPDSRPEILGNEIVSHDVLRRPFFLDSGRDTAVDVLFADWSTARYYLITLSPRETKDGRLHIPIGIAGPMNPPRMNRATENLQVARPAGAGTTFVMYSIDVEGIEYVRYLEGKAEEPRYLALDDELTIDRARGAIERLAGAR